MRLLSNLVLFFTLVLITGCAPRQPISETDMVYLLEIQKRLNTAEEKLKVQDEKIQDLNKVTSATNKAIYKLDLDNRLTQTEKNVESIKKQVQELNLTAINNEQSAFDQRLQAVEGNVKQLDKNLIYMDSKTDKLESKVGQVEKKIASLESLGFQKPPETVLKKELFEKFFKLSEKQKGQIQRWLKEEKPSIKSKRGQTQKGIDIENIPAVISQRVQLESEKEPLFFETNSSEIVVSNAGQVLFHPFVSGLFDHFGWLDPQKQIIDKHKHKAIQTLHYCATGKDVYMESEMILEKFLCGIPLKSTLPINSLLNDQIRQETNHMLTELIKKWPALKNTSPDGLRQMFVMRRGKLIQQESWFKLIVERKVQDILLEKLPWGLSIVKLPWVKKLLFVEW